LVLPEGGSIPRDWIPPGETQTGLD
jgi:hypothetical protein